MALSWFNNKIMATFLVIAAVLLWCASLALLWKRILLGPALSYCALLVISFAKQDGYAVVPLSQPLLVSWLCITLVVMLAVILQNPAIRQQSRGVGYMLTGAVAGMVCGLACCTLSTSLQLLYGIMIVGTAIGICAGMLLFSRTPEGAAVSPQSGHFAGYLMAKGFPVLVTVAQIGIVAIILVYGHMLAA